MGFRHRSRYDLLFAGNAAIGGWKMKPARWLVVLSLLPTAALAALSSSERKSQFEKAMIALMAAATPQMQSATRGKR
jgi:hypothetical protein